MIRLNCNRSKSGENVKKTVVIILLLLIVGLGSYFVFNQYISKSENSKGNTKEEVSKKNSDSKYTFEKTDTGNIIFYKDGKKYREFDCNGKECDVSSIVYDKDTALIGLCDADDCNDVELYDGSYYIYFYNFENDESKSSSGKLIIYDIINDESRKIDNVSQVTNIQDELSLIKINDEEETNLLIDIEGKINRKIDYESLIFSCNNGCVINYNVLDYDKDYLIYKNSEKYGIQKLSDGSILINPTYDYIRFVTLYTQQNSKLYSKYFIAKENDKYNLYSTESNSKVTKNGYEDLFFVNEELLLAYSDKEIHFINLKEEELTNETILVESFYSDASITPYDELGISVYVDEKNVCNITIYEGTSQDDAKIYKYAFDLKRHSLYLK